MTAVSDNFNRANGALGADWDPAVGDPAGAAIVSNKVQVAVVASIGRESYNAATFAPDQYAQVTIITLVVQGANGSVGVLLRVSTTEETYYVFEGDNQGQSTISKHVAGAVSTIANLGNQMVANDIIRGVARGTSLALLQNGVTIVTGVDSAIQSTTRPGIQINSNSNAGDTELDNFNAADFTVLSFREFPKPKIRDAVRAGWIS